MTFLKPHGIMFHHFHDENKHIVSQGSISTEELNDLLDYYGKTYSIIGAEEFLQKADTNDLQQTDVCLTFDDSLLCQYDIAFPVLKDRGLTAFWFIYTSPLDQVMEKLEIYRHFRFSVFQDIDLFYSTFFDLAKKKYPDIYDRLREYDLAVYLRDFPFYTHNDKKFRYLRDVLLGEDRYDTLMDYMLIQYQYDVEQNSKVLWMNAEAIRDLHNNGHIIGLHSHSHSTVLGEKSYEEQYREYKINKDKLERVIGEDIKAVSYPCNSYNSDTIECMKEMGIRIGFRADMTDLGLKNLRYEFPRVDHANIIKMMEGSK